MAVATRPFFDTSVLLAGLVDVGPASGPAQHAMDAVAEARVDGPCTAWHCCLEFYAVATRLPPEFRLRPADALRLLESEVLGRFDVQQLPAGACGEFLRAAARDGSAGGAIYDAHIAEVAFRSRAQTLVTDNRRHFTSLLRHGVRVLTTAEFVEELRKRR
jgi:predicted nucleic acid-binding protein